MFIEAIRHEAERRRAELSEGHPEVDFLATVAHTFNNYLPGFRGNLKRTFVMSPEDSDMFPLEVIEGEAFLGVPRDFFAAILRFPIEGLRYLPGKPGVYLVFAMGPRSRPDRAAIRIYQRPARVTALEGHRQVALVKIDGQGEILDRSPAGLFRVPVWPASGLDWESWEPF